jgi:hypothetical protein
LLAAPVAAVLALSLYLFGGARRQAPANQPVISEEAYLSAVAQEHAGYASDHPLIDTAAANLAATISKTRELPAAGEER